MKTVILILISFINCIILPQDRWLKTNGPVGAFITALSVKGDTLIVGTGNEKAIIFYSLDGGEKWQHANFKLGAPYQANYPARVYGFAFTNDRGVVSILGAKGIYKSNNLIAWNKVYSNNLNIFSISDAISGELYFGTENGNIFKSSDNGISWSAEFNKFDSWIEKIVSIKDKIFAGAYGELISKFQKESLWQFVNVDTTIGSIRPFADDHNNIFFYSHFRLYKSVDDGLTWNYNQDSAFFYGSIVYDGIYNNRIILGNSDETGWFGNTWGIAVSDDEVMSWRLSNSGLPPKFSASLYLAKSGNNTYLGTNAAGVFKSTNFGDSWFPVNNGITASDVLDLTRDKSGTLYSASWSNGIQKSTDNGESWSVINDGLTNSYVYSIVADSNNFLMTGTEEGTFRSYDHGENWLPVTPVGNNFVYKLVKDNYDRIYAQQYGKGIYRTTDLGTTWKRMDNGFGSLYVFALTFDSHNNMYAGTRQGYIFKSTDDGATWSELRNSTQIGNSVVVAIHCSSSGDIYAANLGEGLLKSTDGGTTWSLCKNGLSSIYLNSIAQNSKGELFVSTEDDKIFSSTDSGATWSSIVSNLNMVRVNKILIDKQDNMFLATDESVWRSNPDYPVSVKEEIKPVISYSLSQNYPNPFNPTTEIKYSIPVTGNVSIKVYDILGKEISSLINEQKEAGEYTVTFNGSRFPSGVYFYTIRAGNFTETKKFMLLK